jgi:hypothetical protein
MKYIAYAVGIPAFALVWTAIAKYVGFDAALFIALATIYIELSLHD